jgi:hypothetical protein
LGDFVALNVSIRKEEGSQVDNFSFPLKKPVKEGQSNVKVSRRK